MYKWTIRHAEILHATINYTASQLAILQMLRLRSQSPWFYLRNNKTPSSKVVVIDSAGKKSKIADHIIVLERLNNFKGWECDVGVDWINIKADGTISGICGNALYDQSAIYNIYDAHFNETFQPTITPTICRSNCWCTFETNMAKRKLVTHDTTKIIPIYIENNI
jgi:hypothetical protein